MAGASIQLYRLSTSDADTKLSRKRTTGDNEEEKEAPYNNRPTKVQKITNTHRAHLHKNQSEIRDKQHTDDESSSQEEPAEATGGSSCGDSSSSSTPDSGVDNRPWWHRDQSKVFAYKRDDFTGKTRPRRMMDDMYDNASAEKLEKYRMYYFKYQRGEQSALPVDHGDDDDDGGDDSGYCDDDSEDDEKDKEGEKGQEKENDDNGDSECVSREEGDDVIDDETEDDDHDEGDIPEGEAKSDISY